MTSALYLIFTLIYFSQCYPPSSSPTPCFSLKTHPPPPYADVSEEWPLSFFTWAPPGHFFFCFVFFSFFKCLQTIEKIDCNVYWEWIFIKKVCKKTKEKRPAYSYTYHGLNIFNVIVNIERKLMCVCWRVSLCVGVCLYVWSV